MRTAITLLSLSLTVSAVNAQAAWTSLDPTPPSGNRTDAVASTDLVNMYVFGGRLPGNVRANDLWRFDPVGGTWTDMAPAGTLPAGRQAHGAAFDHTRGVLVVFGGRVANGNGGIAGDTWEWDSATNTWTDLTPAAPVIGVNTPPELEGPMMVYEPAHGRCLMFGGRGNTTTAPMETNETWAWDGVNWTKLNPTTSPPVRRNFAFGYDEASGTGLVYGGIASGSALGDTWAWDGADWSPVATATTPFDNGTHSGALLSRMAYDGVRGRFVLTSGVYPGGAPLTANDTYEFDGTDWINRGGSGMPPRYSGSCIHVPSTGKTYYYGGFNGGQLSHIFEYQTNAVASFSPNSTAGLACPNSGSATTPTQQLVSLPWLGETFAIDVADLNGSALIQAMLLNFGAPIAPINLAVLGFPACNFVAGPELSFPLVGGQFSAGLPNDLGMIGFNLFTQAMTVELPFHIAASERADAVFGAL